MKIGYFLENAYLDLFTSLQRNIEHYKTTDEWIKEYFKGRHYYKDSPIDANLPALSVEVGDIINVKMLYDSLKGKLNPKQASQPRLWSYLTHTQYWKYSVKRWSKDADTIAKLRQRFFCGSERGNRRGFMRNSVAQLWWFGYLTYQEDNPSNRYILTELLLSNSDLCKCVVEVNFSMNKNITSGILLAIKEINDTQKNEVTREEWRALCKYINRKGAVCILDALTQDEIKEISLNYIMNLRKR
ncbi:MAG: DUF6339 family protein [Firmicutes bacterium]|nr:DUF6339 family protein [Bacillota bacterium]